MNKNNTEEQLKQLIGIFILNGKFQKEKFREFVLKKMHKTLFEIKHLTIENKYANFWQKVNDYAVVIKSEDLKMGIVKIKKLSKNLETWIGDSVVNQEKFNFCILTKALEIGSGNETYDYFQAQLIRHDQLLAVLLVFEESSKHLRELVKLKKEEIEESRHLLFFLDKTIDERIFELAVRFYELRSSF